MPSTALMIPIRTALSRRSQPGQKLQYRFIEPCRLFQVHHMPATMQDAQFRLRKPFGNEVRIIQEFADVFAEAYHATALKKAA